jgi:hypothetical protein
LTFTFFLLFFDDAHSQALPFISCTGFIRVAFYLNHQKIWKPEQHLD